MNEIGSDRFNYSPVTHLPLPGSLLLSMYISHGTGQSTDEPISISSSPSSHCFLLVPGLQRWSYNQIIPSVLLEGQGPEMDTC